MPCVPVHQGQAPLFTDCTHSRTVVGTLMNKVCSGKSPCRCSAVGLKDIVTLLALRVTTENSVLRAKPEDRVTGLGQCCSAADEQPERCCSTMLSLDRAHVSKLRETYWHTTPVIVLCGVRATFWRQLCIRIEVHMYMGERGYCSLGTAGQQRTII